MPCYHTEFCSLPANTKPSHGSGDQAKNKLSGACGVVEEREESEDLWVVKQFQVEKHNSLWLTLGVYVRPRVSHRSGDRPFRDCDTSKYISSKHLSEVSGQRFASIYDS